MLWTKRAHQCTIFQTSECSPNSSCHVWNFEIFLQTLHHPSWEITLSQFFSWNCIWFGQKKPIKVQNFKLFTAPVKFHQIYTLIGSFYWKYIKFQLKKYRGVMSHDTKEWCKIWRKTDLLFQKCQEFRKFWLQHSKVSKVCTLIVSFFARYIMFELKKYRVVILRDTEEWCKIWRKTDL